MALRHIFIVNPKAGKHNSTQFINDAASKSLSGISYEIIVTRHPKHATEIARDLCFSGDECRIYACGGDGTLNEVVNGVYKGGCPDNVSVGCIPIGSGNDFIKYFEDLDTNDFLDLGRQAVAKTKKIDLLEVGGYVSLNIMSVGFDAAVCDNIEHFRKIPFVNGSAAYNMSLVYCLISHLKNKLTLYADGKKVAENKDYIFALAANGRYYGGGYKAAPYAVFDDGLIDFVRIPTVSRLKFARLVGTFRRGEHLDKIDICEHTLCKKIKIVTNEPICVNIDGEIVKMKNPEIKILPKKLNLIIP